MGLGRRAAKIANNVRLVSYAMRQQLNADLPVTLMRIADLDVFVIQTTSVLRHRSATRRVTARMARPVIVKIDVFRSLALCVVVTCSVRQMSIAMFVRGNVVYRSVNVVRASVTMPVIHARSALAIGMNLRRQGVRPDTAPGSAKATAML